MCKPDWMDACDALEYEYDDPKPVYCEDCGAQMTLIIDNHYGADIDGNRGIRAEWYECPDCG